MKNIFKYLKKSKIAIFFIFILLVFQAYCDLALPEYTAKMVNVGIQQSGIEEITPKVIRENKLNNLLLFASDKEKEKIKNSYKNLSKTKKNIKRYPELENQNILILKNSSNLDDFFKRALMINSYLLDKDTGKEIKNNLLNSISDSKYLKDKDIYEILILLPKENKIILNKQINDKLTDFEDSILKQAAIKQVKEEYKAIGINTDRMQSNYIVKFGTLMLVIALISMVLTIVVAYVSSKVSASLGKNLRDSVFNKVLSFSSAEFKNFSTASLITRSTNDIQQIQMLAVMLLRIVFYAPIMAIGGIIKVLNTNNEMTWIIAVGIAIIMLFVIILFIITMPKFKKLQIMVDKVNLVAREILSGLSVIRAFGTQKHETKRFDKANIDLTKTNLFVNRTMALMIPIMMLAMNLITVTIVFVGAGHIDNGNMQVGDMMAFMQYAMEIIMSFLMIAMVSIFLPRAIVSLNRVNEVITSNNIIIEPKESKSFIPNQRGYVEFRNVSFRYSDANYDVINDINFISKPGETTALIGSTGSGKSTVINLIPRFFDVTDGEVLVGGVNVKDINSHELRKKIGFVPQKGVLFSGDIKSNITYGNDEATDKEINKALKISQSEEFVKKLDKGIDYLISQEGKNVSGGQRQRLSIARAIAVDPDIFIFDDSFSALDFKTDAKLRHDLKQITKNKTTIIVAQRISTIMYAEQIIVLDEGKIVDKGTHKELIERCDIYKQIALSQLSKEEI